MIKPKSEMPKEISVDLSGPEGNAFVLMGYAKKWGKQMGLDTEALIKEMTSGDYENLVDVLEREFGEFVTFYR